MIEGGFANIKFEATLLIAESVRIQISNFANGIASAFLNNKFWFCFLPIFIVCIVDYH